MKKIFMVTIDGTSDGEYENCACSVLFKTKEEAVNYVNADFIDDIINDGIVAEDADHSTIDGALQEHCTWWSEWSASYKWGKARTDYKIEEVGIPE